MMNIKTFSKDRFMNPTVLAGIIISFSCFAFLAMPIWPIIIYSSSIPHGMIFTRHSLAIPNCFTFFGTKKEFIPFQFTDIESFFLTANITGFIFRFGNRCFPPKIAFFRTEHFFMSFYLPITFYCWILTAKTNNGFEFMMRMFKSGLLTLPHTTTGIATKLPDNSIYMTLFSMKRLSTLKTINNRHFNSASDFIIQEN